MTQQEAPAPEMPKDPTTPNEFNARGWILYVKDQFKEAEQDFRAAIKLDERSVEGWYALAMALKMQGHKQEAIDAFNKTRELLNDDAMVDDPARATMLRHLSRAHTEMIQQGIDLNPEP